MYLCFQILFPFLLIFHGALTHHRKSIVIWECLSRQVAPLIYVDLYMCCFTYEMAE